MENLQIMYIIADSISGDHSNVFAEFKTAKLFYHNTGNMDLNNNYSFSLSAMIVNTETGEIFLETANEIMSAEVLNGQIFYF
jgi:hypothetical protein